MFQNPTLERTKVHLTWCRDNIKQKYFPEKRSWLFEGKTSLDMRTDMALM
jgi:hypothetical protein